MQKNCYTSLVIGDVGSGKTYIALLSAIGFLFNSINAKATIMAPTEVLAYQHYLELIRILELLEITDITYIYYTSKNILVNNQKQKKFNYQELVDKKVIFVGTHSIINLKEFKIDLVIVDEQHRFGVNQRGSFASNHHFLSFTATPIPRSLALSLFSKLNTQFIEKLKSRTEVATELLNIDSFFSPAYINYIKDNYTSKQAKVYIVCPKIETKEAGEGEDKIYSTIEVFDYLNKYFPNQVMMLTGKDKNKKDNLLEFKNNFNLKILVATSVIEVGVDISTARLMIIINAERFGLAALHQLRGRVGRNDLPDNKCYLCLSKKYMHSTRLRTLVDNYDGFKIAEYDLKNRGSGDMAGIIQSGFSNEIENLLKSQPDDLEKLQKIVDNLNLGELPRLQKYLESKNKEYHGE